MVLPLSNTDLSALIDAAAEFCCNGTVVDDPELGQVRLTSLMVPCRRPCSDARVGMSPGDVDAVLYHAGSLCPDRLRKSVLIHADLRHVLSTYACMQVIQLQGDQRKNVLQFLTQEKLVKKEFIKIHGF